VAAWFQGLPGTFKTLFIRIGDFITAPFRAAFNFVARAWNNTIGQLSWTVPSWIPGIGGNSISAPRLPQFHGGGIVPGSAGAEVAILARGGELVLTAEQARALGGPRVIENHIHIGDEVVRVIRTEIRDDKRATRRAVLAGVGAR
jgi:hypothetical protein